MTTDGSIGCLSDRSPEATSVMAVVPMTHVYSRRWWTKWTNNKYYYDRCNTNNTILYRATAMAISRCRGVILHHQFSDLGHHHNRDQPRYNRNKTHEGQKNIQQRVACLWYSSLKPHVHYCGNATLQTSLGWPKRRALVINYVYWA